jgi:hypothetical protein
VAICPHGDILATCPLCARPPETRLEHAPSAWVVPSRAPDDGAHERIAALEAENADLRRQLDALTKTAHPLDAETMRIVAVLLQRLGGTVELRMSELLALADSTRILSERRQFGEVLHLQVAQPFQWVPSRLWAGEDEAYELVIDTMHKARVARKDGQWHAFTVRSSGTVFEDIRRWRQREAAQEQAQSDANATARGHAMHRKHLAREGGS